MALERRDASQVVTYSPPQPQWSFALTGGGVTTGGTGQGFGEYFTVTTANAATISVGDLFQLYTTAGMVLTEPQVFTVAYLAPPSAGNVSVYFTPATTAETVPATGMTATSIPAAGNARWLGSIGHVTGLKYSYVMPGGPEQMSCLLQVPPYYRTDAISPGRVVRIFRGASCVWDGKLDEPQPAVEGWTISAHGAGTFGADFTSIWNTWNADDPINQAIARGLRWVNPGIGAPSGIWLVQQQDPGSQTITDFLNLITIPGSLTWYVDRGNTLRVLALPTAVNRLLVSTNPVPRTLSADINKIVLRYQAAADGGAASGATATSATYGLAAASVPASIDAHGPMEHYLDVSSGGTMAAGDAINVGNLILSHYQRANFAGAFTVGPGQLLTAGGYPVDLGAEQAGTVCQLICTDAPFGGEVVAGPVTFIVGKYEYDDETYTATVTPYQSHRTDLGTLISSLYPRGGF